MEESKLKKKILSLYNNPRFSGCFSGVSTIKRALFTDYHLEVPEKEIIHILRHDKNYISSIRNIRRFPRRHVKIGGAFIEFQADLAQMFPYKGFKYILVVTDLYDHMIWAKPLRNKSSKSVEKGFKEIFTDIQKTGGHKPATLSSDQVSSKQLFITA